MSLTDPGQTSKQDLGDLAIQMYFKTDTARKIEAVAAGEKSAKAARPLFWLAFLHSFLPLLTLGILQRALAAGNPGAWLLLAAFTAVAIAFWGIWAWSLLNPLPAAIVGLLLYTSIIYLGTALRTNGSGHAPVVAILGIALLTKAILNGTRQRRLAMADVIGPDGLPVKQNRSIASAIWLYLVLLSIVVIPKGLAAEHNFAFSDQLDVYKLMAIIVAAWAAICWRDVLPAIRKVANINWFVIALLMGTMTAVFASLYGDVIAFFVDAHSAGYAKPMLDAGCGWLTIVGLIALYPAIFEELAFRGVIIPGLQRVLSNKEVIAVSGIMFMILHLNIINAPALLAAGLILGYMRIRSGSLWPGVLMHFTHNALILGFEHWHF